MAINTSSQMNLPIPQVGNESGPQYATDINNCLSIIDQHNHASGSGVPITPAGLNISSDLSFLNNNLTNARSLRLQLQPSLLSNPADIVCLYGNGVDLYFNDANGNQIQITTNGGVAGASGSISGLSSPASASYVAGNQTFVWQSAANTPANMDAASYIFRNLSANSFGLTLSPPNAMGADYSIVLPALPASQKFLTLDASGNMGASWTPDNSTITVSANQVQIASNANLPGSQVKVNSRYPVVSNTNETGALSMLRGRVDSTGVILTGSGFTASHTSQGKYLITFDASFADVPSMPCVSNDNPNFLCAIDTSVPPTSSAISITILDTQSHSLANSGFDFIAVGLRA